MSELSSAAAAMGRSRSTRKVEAARENVAKARERLTDPDVQAKRQRSQQERRERERAEKAALGLPAVTSEKKQRGRPRKAAEGAAG